MLIGERGRHSDAANRRDVGFVFQNYALFPHLSVFENVAYGLAGQALRARHRFVRRAGLRQVGLAGLERSHDLGAFGRAAAARRAGACDRDPPRVLCSTSRSSNLDAQLRVQMRSEIRRLQQELDITAVYVTHDQDEAMAIRTASPS